MPKYKVNIEELGYEAEIDAEDEDQAEEFAMIECKMNLHEYVTAETEEIGKTNAEIESEE